MPASLSPIRTILEIGNSCWALKINCLRYLRLRRYLWLQLRVIWIVDRALTATIRVIATLRIIFSAWQHLEQAHLWVFQRPRQRAILKRLFCTICEMATQIASWSARLIEWRTKINNSKRCSSNRWWARSQLWRQVLAGRTIIHYLPTRLKYKECHQIGFQSQELCRPSSWSSNQGPRIAVTWARCTPANSTVIRLMRQQVFNITEQVAALRS